MFKWARYKIKKDPRDGSYDLWKRVKIFFWDYKTHRQELSEAENWIQRDIFPIKRYDAKGNLIS